MYLGSPQKMLRKKSKSHFHQTVAFVYLLFDIMSGH